MRIKKKLLFLVLIVLVAAASHAAADIVISEVMASNGVYQNEHAYDWIELHNTGRETITLAGYRLSDREDKPGKWVFPDGVKLKGGEYLLVYCTGEELAKGKGSVYYANFKISASGETLVLSDNQGEVLQMLALGPQYGNVSYGIPEGGDGYAFLAEATPGKQNAALGYPVRAMAPVIETAAGFYEAEVTVAVSNPQGVVIRYTTDGSEPTLKSEAYQGPLRFAKTTVLRVRAFADGQLPSATVTASYFVDDPSVVAVVSLVTDEKYLFNKKTGALVRGSGSIPNYDKEWEYPVNIEYFTADGFSEINQIGTFTAAGHSARQNAQKSIAIYARRAYGEDLFHFNPMPNREYESYKSLLLRSANSDAWSTRLRDPVFSSAAEELGLIYQDALPIVVYINGEYWGHYNLREKINKYFVAQWEGVEKEKDIDDIDILARTGIDDYVQNGSNADWLALMDFCRNNDLNDSDNLRYVTDRLDVDSFFTHTAFEMILGNTDMTNVRMYRVPGGKWKYLLFDVEAGFLSLDSVPIEYYAKRITAKRQYFQHVHFAALMAVPEMKRQFLMTYAEVLETAFLWTDMEPRFLQWEAVLAQLLPRHIERWPSSFSMTNWRKNVNAVKYYARVRPRKSIDMLCKALKVGEEEKQEIFGRVIPLLEEAMKIAE